MPALALSSLPAGVEVLIDANIIAYGLQGRSLQCEHLLRRCGVGEISGFTTIEALSDVCHRLMLTEAADRGLIGRPNTSNLQGKVEVIRQLSDYWHRLANVMTGAIAILPLDDFRFTRAHPLRVAHGLMTNDSLLLAAADVFGIDALVSNDSDFDSILWLDIYKPTDLN